MIPFNFHHLYYFYVVAGEGCSFTRATKILRVSQPALSAQLKLFQRYWSVELFSRDKSRVALSEHGNLIFDYAKAIFDLGHELSHSLLDKKSRTRLSLRLGVSVAVPRAIVAALLRHVYAAFPEVRLVLKQEPIENMISALASHKLDLVMNDFAYQADIERGLQNHLVATVPMVFCASRALANKFPNIPADLDGAPLIVPTAPDQTYHALQNYLHRNRVRPNVVAEVQDLEQVRALVAMGKGVGLLNSYALLNSSERNNIVIFKNQSKPPIVDTIYLIQPQRKIAHTVTDHVVREFKIKDEAVDPEVIAVRRSRDSRISKGIKRP